MLTHSIELSSTPVLAPHLNLTVKSTIHPDRYPAPLWQVVREDAARVQQLLRSQTAELTASQMMVKQLEGAAPPAAPHADVQELQQQLQVVQSIIFTQGYGWGVAFLAWGRGKD
jgi:hypothetical protein